MNIAARAGRWSARHRTKAIVGWLVFVALAFVAGGAVGVNKATDADGGAGDSGKAERVIEKADFKRPDTEQVLVQTRNGGRLADPGRRAAVTDVVAAVERTGQVTDVRSPLAAGNAGQISKDGRSVLVIFDMRGDPDNASDHVQPVLDAVARVQASHPDLRVEQFGEASAAKALDESIGKDFKRAEFLSIPITVAILLVAFGALVAALVPVSLALTAIVAAGGLLAFTSKALPADDTASSVMLLIGLAVGVDYSLFYVRREREERAAGRGKLAAIDAAAATSGRSVLVSGITVVAAMSAMFLIGDGTFVGIAEATVLVVAVAVAGSLTVLPALLSTLGDKVNRGRVPWLGKWLERRRATARGGAWAVVLGPVMRRPAVAAVGAVGVLVVLALPLFKLHTNVPGTADLPKNLPVVQTYDRMQAAFPGGPSPANVVVSAKDVTAPPVRAAIDDLRRRAIASHQMSEPVTIETNAAKTVAVVNIPLAGDGQDSTSQKAVTLLRDDLLPATVRTVADAHVTGETAGSMDFNAQLKQKTPLVFGFVLTMAFLLLLWTFRSVVIALKAILLNLLSVGAAYGVLVATFQWGWGESLLGFTSTGGIVAWLPLFLFVVLFGLSMDYHVFILSRVREAYDRGESTRDAVRHGITSTAGVVTSAAVIMVAVFSVFGTLSQVSFKQLGVGLGVAILLDATVVRAVLLPAVMVLLGDRNWYLPKWLNWIPKPALVPEAAPGEDPPPHGRHRELARV